MRCEKAQVVDNGYTEHSREERRASDFVNQNFDQSSSMPWPHSTFYVLLLF